MIAPMQTWALTGPAGAGKSVVSQMLAQRGAAIVDADRLGHELLELPDIQAAIVGQFGPAYVTERVVDRPALGALVFTDPKALLALNEIMHGPLAQLAQQKLADLAEIGEHKLAVFEAAVYFLLPSPPVVDLVVAVVASPQRRIERLVARSAGQLSVEQATGRVAAQSNMESYWPQADEIIVNDGTLDELEACVARLAPRPSPGSEKQS